MCHEKNSNLEEAEKDLITALKLEPENINFLFHLGNIQDKLDKIDLSKNNYLA
jgi:stalled ribosome rescue protein Dom34